VIGGASGVPEVGAAKHGPAERWPGSIRAPNHGMRWTTARRIQRLGRPRVASRLVAPEIVVDAAACERSRRCSSDRQEVAEVHKVVVGREPRTLPIEHTGTGIAVMRWCARRLDRHLDRCPDGPLGRRPDPQLGT
jgi:hypothetical protein